MPPVGYDHNGPIWNVEELINEVMAEIEEEAQMKTTREDEVHCEICNKKCSHEKGENETCSACGLVICKQHCVMVGENPVCTECKR